MNETANGPIPLQAVPATPAPTTPVPVQSVPVESDRVQSVPVQSVPVQSVPVRDRRLPADDDEGPLLADTEELRLDWQRIKASFVDNPRGSVAQAASAIDEAIDRLVAALHARQDRGRDTWDRDGRDTESLRQALLTYQALFDRITGL